jgi:ribosomal protein S27AE
MDTQPQDQTSAPPVEAVKTPVYQVVKSCPKCGSTFSTVQVTEAAFINFLGTPNFEAVTLENTHSARTRTLCPSCEPVTG